MKKKELRGISWYKSFESFIFYKIYRIIANRNLDFYLYKFSSTLLFTDIFTTTNHWHSLFSVSASTTLLENLFDDAIE